MLVFVWGLECTPCNYGFLTWLDAPLIHYGKASILKGCKRGCNYHQCGVGVIYVGLCEPHAPLALWLGLTMADYSMWTWTLITQSLIIRHIGGIIFLKAAPILQDDKHFEWVWGSYKFTSVQCWFLSEVLNAPHAIMAFWLGWMHH